MTLSGTSWAKRVWLVTVCVLLVFAVAAALWAGRRILLLVFAGVLFAVVLNAITGWIARHLHLKRSWALALTTTLLLLLFGGTAWLVGDRLNAEISQLSQQLSSLAVSLHHELQTRSWGRAVLHAMPSPEDLLSHTSTVAMKSWTAVWGLLGVAANVVVIFFVGLYLAADPALYRNGLLRLFPVSTRPKLAAALDCSGATLGHWLLGKLSLMCFVGVVTAIGLWLLGVPLVLTMALLAAALDFIPNIGPISSAVPALLLALAKGPMTVLWVALLYFAVQLVESYILSPLVQHRAVSLPPALLICSQVLMAVLLGLPGLLLATPLTVLLLVLVRMLYVEDVLERKDASKC